jgi:RNA polymerase sigma-70 factor (ECF subfamily)
MTASEWQTLTDEEAVRRVRGGETSVYEALMRRHNQRLFRIARSVVRDDAEAEDVLQDAWVRAYEHLDQFAGRATFATWVTKIAFYEALSRARKAKRVISIDAQNGDPMKDVDYADLKTPDPERQAIGGELRQAVESAVDELPDTYRSVFVLREIEQLSTAETAECLNLSLEAVKTRLHRSRALLRRDLASRMGPAITATYAFLGDRCDRVVARVMGRVARPGGVATGALQ